MIMMLKKEVMIMILVISLSKGQETESNCKEGMKELGTYLCITSDYQQPIPAAIDEKDFEGVTFHFSNIKVIDVDEKKQTIIVSFDYTAMWRDGRIEFGKNFLNQPGVHGTKELQQVWSPSMKVLDQIELKSEPFMGDSNLLYFLNDNFPNGNGKPASLYISMAKVEFACEMVFDEFPFDKQNCSMKVFAIHHKKHQPQNTMPFYLFL